MPRRLRDWRGDCFYRKSPHVLGLGSIRDAVRVRRSLKKKCSEMKIYEEIDDQDWNGVWQLWHGGQCIQFYNEYRARAHFHKVLDNAELWYLDEDENGPVAKL